MASQNLITLIRPVWQELCDKLGLKMTGLGKFVQRNARALWESFPNRDAEFSATNFPDMTKMLVSDGNLEGANKITATTPIFIPFGSPANVTVTWDVLTYRNGKPNDVAHLAVYVNPTTEEFTRRVPRGILYTKNTGQPRSAGAGTITIPRGTVYDQTAFVFFADACANYSPSIAGDVTFV